MSQNHCEVQTEPKQPKQKDNSGEDVKVEVKLWIEAYEDLPDPKL